MLLKLFLTLTLVVVVSILGVEFTRGTRHWKWRDFFEYIRNKASTLWLIWVLIAILNVIWTTNW